MMNFSGKRKISLAITILLFLIFFFANIYAIRQMGYYAVELFFYDKMLVAYQVGGVSGIDTELERIILEEKLPREIAIARAFKDRLKDIRAPEEFLEDIVKEKKDKINLFRRLRNIAFVCIAALVLLRVMLNKRRPTCG